MCGSVVECQVPSLAPSGPTMSHTMWVRPYNDVFSKQTNKNIKKKTKLHQISYLVIKFWVKAVTLFYSLL